MSRHRLGLIVFIAGLGILLSTTVATSNLGRLIGSLPSMLGYRGEKQFLVLLQNQTELRPTGGFLGSYAVVTAKNGQLNYTVEDIYVPDGKVTRHIAPPPPIQEAFQLGTWRLRDANWDPDFPTAAQTVAWFMDQAGLPKFDGVFATNLIVFERLLGIIGPVYLVDYREEISADNLWEKAQFYAHHEFFPGSKQKREFLADVARASSDALLSSSAFTRLRLIMVFYQLLEEKQMLIYLADPDTEMALDRLGWSGSIRHPSCPPLVKSCIADTFMLVEANLGVNKANCCIDRSADVTVTKTSASLHYRVSLQFVNNSDPTRWGGDYKAWVRLLHSGAEEDFWLEIPVGESETVTREYDMQYDENASVYSLLVQKQPGIGGYPLRLQFVEEEKTTQVKRNIVKDTAITLVL